ncbi:MAG TPA: GNAT family protein [Gaiellales bacterium]
MATAALTEPSPPLTASGVVLRRLRAADADWIAAACSDPEMGRYAPALPHPYLPAHAHAFVDHAQRGWRGGSRAVFAIVDALAGTGMGLVELHLSARNDDVATIGYWLAREHRGRGHATAAVRLVAGWAFDVLAIARLEITADPENTPSIRVAERAGFERTAYLPARVETRAGPRDRILLCRKRP